MARSYYQGSTVIFFYWLIAIMPLESHRFWGYQIVGALTIVKLVGLLCFVVAVFRLFQGSRPPFLQSAASRWFAAFFLFQCSSYLVQGGKLANPGDAYTQIVSFFLLFVTTLTLVNSRPRLRRALLVAIGAVGFTSLYAIREWQKYHGMYAEFRPGGMLSDANEYALIAGLWMPLAFLWASGKRPRWERVFCLGCFACCALGIAFAASRGCILGMGASFLFLIWHSRHRARNLALTGVLLLPIGLVGSHSVLNRYLHPSRSDQLAKQARIVAWQAGWNMISAHPMFGIGLETFKAAMPDYQPKSVKTDTVAHNTYVEVAAELGIPALLVFLGMWVVSFRMLGQVRIRTRMGRLRGLFPIALGLQAGIVSYLVDAFFLSTTWYKMVWLLLFLAITLNELEKALRTPETEIEETTFEWASYLDAQVDQPTRVP